MGWARCKGCGFTTHVSGGDTAPEECLRCKGKPLEWKTAIKAADDKKGGKK